MISKVLFFSAFIALTSAACNLPTRFWCDSKSIAKECGVELQCADQYWVEDLEAEPVMVDLYMESLCPDCINFINKMMYPTWKKFKGTNVMKFTAFPYGNAHEMQDPSSGMWKYTCQHGAEECTGNLIENCVQKYSNYDVMKYFPIFYCMESATDPIKAAQGCVTKGNLTWSVISTCANGAEGNALMHKTAMATDKLDPPHKYVPWIVVNGEHTEAIQTEAQGDLAKLLCDTYKGPKPSQCMEHMAPQPLYVSYRND